MATMVGTQAELTSFLKQLIELEYDAVEAYKVAVERLSDLDVRRQIGAFQMDHERHVTELTRLLQDLGGVAPEGGDVKQILTKGKVFLGSLLGDRAILTAMRSNENDTNTAYERAVLRNDLTDAIRVVMETHLADERRHRAWIDQQLTADERTSISP